MGIHFDSEGHASTLVCGPCDLDYKPFRYLDFKRLWVDAPSLSMEFPRSCDHGGLVLGLG